MLCVVTKGKMVDNQEKEISRVREQKKIENALSYDTDGRVFGS